MIDRDLAMLYGVDTRTLNQAVRRNLARFPEDFMFEMSAEEMRNWVSQFVIPKSKKMGIRIKPLVFTEQGVAMLSSVLKSERAIMVNIQIIRTFSKLREMVEENDTLRRKLEVMEKQYDEQFKVVFDALKQLLEVKEHIPDQIGFRG